MYSTNHCCSRGSSPLTRGKPFAGGWCNDTNGLIPAHAGKTVRAGQRRSADTAHPRSRGENMDFMRSPTYMAGSSPLTRGKLTSPLPQGMVDGLIPAHAGKTHVPSASGHGGRAHPRSRGENHHQCRQRVYGRGSSPLTRGKPGVQDGVHAEGGLIPAHAGKTSGLTATATHGLAHPRSRGENVLGLHG